jgi:hypothetical protein
LIPTAAPEAPDFFLYKASIAPLLVMGATLAGRRWGQTAAGLVAGLPIVAGPILFFYALEQGPAYAAVAARDTLLGLFSLSLFVLGYAWRAWTGASALSCVIVGWAAFALGTALIGHVHAELWQAFLWALGSLYLARRSLPPMEESAASAPPSPWDLPLRGLSAALLVLALTHFARSLGPALGGFLAPFPVASTVLAVFAQNQGGGAAAVAVLKGLLLALNAFAVFCATLCLALPGHSLALSFALAVALAVVLQGALVWMTQKR